MLNDTNDSLGGAGSLAQSLQNLAVNGLSKYIDGALSKKYPLASGDATQTLGPDGKARPLTAPAKPASAGAAFAGFLKNPNVMLVGVAVAASVALFLVLRK